MPSTNPVEQILESLAFVSDSILYSTDRRADGLKLHTYRRKLHVPIEAAFCFKRHVTIETVLLEAARQIEGACASIHFNWQVQLQSARAASIGTCSFNRHVQLQSARAASIEFCRLFVFFYRVSSSLQRALLSFLLTIVA
jgi:hypothetical protein